MSEENQQKKMTLTKIGYWIFLWPIMGTVFLWKRIQMRTILKVPAFIIGWTFLLSLITLLQQGGKPTQTVDERQEQVLKVQESSYPVATPIPSLEIVTFTQEAALSKIQSYKLTQPWNTYKAGITVKNAVEDWGQDKGKWNISPSDHDHAFVVEYVSEGNGFRPKWTVKQDEIIALNGTARRVTPELEAKIEVDRSHESQKIHQEVKDHMNQLFDSKDSVTVAEEDVAFGKITKELARKYNYTEKEIAEIYTRVSLENAAKYKEQNKDLMN